MAYIQAKKHKLGARSAIASALLLALPAMALAETDTAKNSGQLKEVKVTADAIEAEFIAEKASSPKQTQKLVDTPQTIVVVKKELFQQQAATSLAETLRNTPGITMLMGENGNTATGGEKTGESRAVRVRFSPKPPYPALSRELGEEGVVLLRISVSAGGQFEQVQLLRSSGFIRLDRAARDGVRSWRFDAAWQGGQPVADSIDIPVRFRLDEL